MAARRRKTSATAMDRGENFFSIGSKPNALTRFDPALSGSASNAGWMFASAARASSSSAKLDHSA